MYTKHSVRDKKKNENATAGRGAKSHTWEIFKSSNLFSWKYLISNLILLFPAACSSNVQTRAPAATALQMILHRVRRNIFALKYALENT